MKKIIFLMSLCVVALLGGCHSSDSKVHTLKVGTIAGPETQLMEVARDVAKHCYGLDIDIVTFSDYNIPNIALNDGSIDANMFQHLPYLTAQAKARHFDIIAVGKTFVYPMGIYSSRLTALSSLASGAKVAVPNDPSNQARALLLLQKAGLITLRPKAGTLATLADIQENPKKLHIVPLAAAQLPRSLSDVAAAVINTNYAIPAGLLLSRVLYAEGADSLYANVIATRTKDADSEAIKELVSALHSQSVLAAAKRIFGRAAIPAWDTRTPVLPCREAADTVQKK